MTETLFWQQFPKGTEDFAFSIVEHFTQAMDETEKKEPTMGEVFSAIGIAVGFILQTACKLKCYDEEKDIKGILYDALKKSYNYFRNSPIYSAIILDFENMSDSELRELLQHQKSLLSDME